MYKNLKYNSEFIANNNFLTLVHMLFGCDMMNKGNTKITEHRTILQRESQNS